jgi:hypothetical protein
MADHACSYPKNRRINDPERYHIPMVITGGALSEGCAGKRISNFCGQLIIPAMLLGEVKGTPQRLGLSVNTILSDDSRAYFVYDNGFGVLSSKGKVVYDLNLKQTIINTNKSVTQELLNFGKYLMQSSAQMKEDFLTLKQF